MNPVYKSLNRPLTILGVERKLFFCAAVMGATTFNMMGSFLGGLLVFAALFIFGQMATKSDPQILRILLNSSRFKAVYCPVKFKAIPVRRIRHD
jgi:type IV secretory pathway VirB3-like protein